MYMSRAKLLPIAVSNNGLWKYMGNNYNVHRLVWSLFSGGSDNTRNFLYRQESNGKLPTFYIVSEEKPDDKSGLWDLDIKPYNPVLKSGQNLYFSIRANPIVSKRDENGKQHRHDVVMDEKLRIKKENPNKVCMDVSEIVQNKGVEWLQKRSDSYGFSIDTNRVRADGYKSHKFYKAKGKHYINISTIDFNGILTINDPELFKKALYHGIGPAKGFGCGLLLVRPVR
ncbi:type I-E CRISPR-associated protein Cas6/Cse3/CasE [Methanohalophilus sp.]|uniref:type I-E CRISPR-associated protein Cas6/Cse3/CasE n=1 Tax=Methanohalophilus sp. TaxID=1966352 RepID=UPI0026207119|nr:type I-E CRISPR-associated protein Cas6/Cse3/CasE [Methanohalophilus sp.]MDK2892836.1 system Cascade subunit CasE [Methanohalophilus sp.]